MRNLLGLARIGKIVYDLRLSRGLLTQKNAKKEYKFQVDIEGGVNIVEKLKKKKLSKIKKARQSYLEDYNNDLSTFNQSFVESNTQEILAGDDEYETIAELTENETHEVK